MSRIAVLARTVADQIAAGEVVERPASVVKELVENALDAGATAIDIAIEDGGRARIRVSDDGSGMSRDDAVLALERHATSKIRAANDLVGVRSFGFRGEALPAICSVSQLEIETAPADGAGTFVRVCGGDDRSTCATPRVGAARRSRVSRLFYNAPARQKFLRGARSEWRGISRRGDRARAHAPRRAPRPSRTTASRSSRFRRHRRCRSPRRGYGALRSPERLVSVDDVQRRDARVGTRRAPGRRRHGATRASSSP